MKSPVKFISVDRVFRSLCADLHFASFSCIRNQNSLLVSNVFGCSTTRRKSFFQETDSWSIDSVECKCFPSFSWIHNWTLKAYYYLRMCNDAAQKFHSGNGSMIDCFFCDIETHRASFVGSILGLSSVKNFLITLHICILFSHSSKTPLFVYYKRLSAHWLNSSLCNF